MLVKRNKEEIIIDDTTIRYNFRIQPVNHIERIYHSGKDKGSWIVWSFPETLDFSNKDTLYIDYASENEDYLKGITFNKDKYDLSCEKKENRLLRCFLHKSHFETSGYYFSKHTNHLGGKSTFYEVSPIKVILKGIYYSSSLNYSLLLILIMF